MQDGWKEKHGQSDGSKWGYCQHMWVKWALQGDLLSWIRFKHLPPPAAGCSSSWKLSLHADMWVLVGQFNAGEFKPLLNNSILVIRSSTSAVQTSSCFCFLNLVYYKWKWGVRSFVFISTWHSPHRCSLGVHAPWLYFFFLDNHKPCIDAYKLKISLNIFFCYNNRHIQDSVNLFSPVLWF